MWLWIEIAELTKTTVLLVGWRILKRARLTKTVPIGSFFHGNPKWSLQHSMKHSEDLAGQILVCDGFCAKKYAMKFYAIF